MTPTLIDINCDLGEGNNLSDCEKDALHMPFISRCNIACGGHAGDDKIMLQSLKNAHQHSLYIGAHPSYPDRENFGRVSLDISLESLQETVLKQISQLEKLANQNNIELSHIKFHGALYNDIEKDKTLANSMANFCNDNFPNLAIMGLANGKLAKACNKIGMNFINEGFMDRVYLSNGSLTPRSLKNSVITNQEQAIQQAKNIALNHPIKTHDGHNLSLKVDSICLHGDNPNSLSIAKNLHRVFSQNNIQIKNE